MNPLALVKTLLAMHGGKQELLAKELDVSQPTISRWLNGGKIVGENRDKVLDLAMAKGLVGERDGTNASTKQIDAADGGDRIDEIDVTAGLGGGGLAILEQTANGSGMSFSAEVVRDFWRLPSWVLGRFNAQASHIKAFPAQGDSMEPTIDDGDVVFVDTRHRVPSPPGVYALADEFGGVVVKRVEVISKPRDEQVIVRIISDNSRHAPRELLLDEINIIGRYVGRFTA